MNTLIHTDFARQLADDRRSAVRIDRRSGSGTGAVRRAITALVRVARPGAATPPESPALASA